MVKSEIHYISFSVTYTTREKLGESKYIKNRIMAPIFYMVYIVYMVCWVLIELTIEEGRTGAGRGGGGGGGGGRDPCKEIFIHT